MFWRARLLRLLAMPNGGVETIVYLRCNPLSVLKKGLQKQSQRTRSKL